MDQRYGTGDLAWFEALLPTVAEDQSVVVTYDNKGRITQLNILKTSDSQVGAMASTSMDVVVIDNAKGPTTGYGHYTEVRMMKEAAAGSIGQGPEIDCWSDKPTADVDPYYPNAPDMVEGGRYNTIVDKAGDTPFPISVALTIGGWYKKAINVMSTFLGPVISMPSGGVLAQWYCPPKGGARAQAGPSIRSDCIDPAKSLRVIFYDGGIAFQTPDGVNRFVLGADGTIYYSGNVPQKI